MFPLSCAPAQLLRPLCAVATMLANNAQLQQCLQTMRSCSNACKQCAVATKILLQRTRLFFRAALLKIEGDIVSKTFGHSWQFSAQTSDGGAHDAEQLLHWIGKPNTTGPVAGVPTMPSLTQTMLVSAEESSWKSPDSLSNNNRLICCSHMSSAE